MEETSGPSIGKRLLALAVLIIAGWFLLKALVGFLVGLLTIVGIVLAVGAVIWAVKTL